MNRINPEDEENKQAMPSIKGHEDQYEFPSITELKKLCDDVLKRLPESAVGILIVANPDGKMAVVTNTNSNLTNRMLEVALDVSKNGGPNTIRQPDPGDFEDN